MAKRIIKLTRLHLIKPGVVLIMFMITSCLQGPWDYIPKDPPVHRGLWVTGYIIAGQPVTDMCIERLLELDEEYTNAFNFYRTANVSISGIFSGTANIIDLSPDSARANCFVGASDQLPEKGQTYELNAVITWDSSGRQVVTNIQATARVPLNFIILDTASAPAPAKTGLSGVIPVNDPLQAVLWLDTLMKSLPPNAAKEIQENVIDPFLEIDPSLDSVQQMKIILGLFEELNKILGNNYIKYPKGSSLYYLTGSFNFMSHYMSSVRSEDVGCVLVTQKFDTLESRLPTLFDSIANIDRKPFEFYYPGSNRRLILYPNAVGQNGYAILDSIGIVNSWFVSGYNRLYFYGLEAAYNNYVESAIFSENDPSVESEYNVTGAAGIFAGGVKDSFDINILTDSITIGFPIFKIHAGSCNDQGWNSSKDCRTFYSSYCSAMKWLDADCMADLVNQSLFTLGLTAEMLVDSIRALDAAGTLKIGPVNLKKDSVTYDLKPLSFNMAVKAVLTFDDGILDGPEDRTSKIEKAQETGEILHCVQNNFNDKVAACKDLKKECGSLEGTNDCKEYLWNFCLDNRWQPQQCGPGLVSYCADKPRQSEILCSQADKYCRDNPDEPLCGIK